VPIDRGINRVYWLTIRPPENTRPGTYTGTITFKPANASASALRLTFRVLPFKLRPLTDRFQALYHDYDLFPGGGPDARVRWQRDTGFNVITTAGRINNVRYKDGVLARSTSPIGRRNSMSIAATVSRCSSSSARARPRPLTAPPASITPSRNTKAARTR
jgi:hypothetical protein